LFVDFVVGAYGSDKAVLLRTRSVLDLQARFDITPSAVSYAQPACVYQGRRTPCMEAQACLKYSGINLPPATGWKKTLNIQINENLSNRLEKYTEHSDK
jgi:hypothetical protein